MSDDWLPNNYNFNIDNFATAAMIIKKGQEKSILGIQTLFSDVFVILVSRNWRLDNMQDFGGLSIQMVEYTWDHVMGLA